MSDQGVRPISSSLGQLVSSGQLVCVDYVRPSTSEGHNSFIRTPIWVFLDSMESPLSQEYIPKYIEYDRIKIKDIKKDLTYNMQMTEYEFRGQNS